MYHVNLKNNCEGTVVLLLVSSTPDVAVWVPALAEDIVLCSWDKLRPE